MVIAREEMPRKSGATRLSVDWSIVQSEEYTNKLKHITSDEKVVKSIETRAKWALNNRDGVDTEELYAINLQTGEEIARIADQHHKEAVVRTKLFTKKLNEADTEGIEILLIHNHPKGMPPSISDINSLLKNRNASGITVGHDGSIYYYTRPKKEIPGF